MIGARKETLGRTRSETKEMSSPRNESMERADLTMEDWIHDRIPSTTPGAEPPRDARDSGSARSHTTHLETSSSNRP